MSQQSVARALGLPVLENNHIKVLPSISTLFYPITLEGRQGTRDEFARVPFQLDLFSASLVELAKSIPLQSLILSSPLF